MSRKKLLYTASQDHKLVAPLKLYRKMWCYQKPGFEALLLAELQRQQQCSQFCDTLLKAEGVSVPAHSCILSAISSHISSSLSSTPVPEAGQRRLLEFRALRACTLLHMVRLLYSGEMVGEGEKEKQEAISAAAKLGIHGLVEMTHNDKHHKKVREGCLNTEVGVQTEPQIPVDNGVRLGGWRREGQDGPTLLWRETLPTRGVETCTQTEDVHMNNPSSSQLCVSYETIDINALQSLGQSESLPIPYVPMSVVYSSEDNQGSGQPSASAVTPSPTVQYSSVQPNVFPIPSQATPCAMNTQSWGRCHEIGRAAVMEEWAEDGFEQFEGNIPGFINYFLNPEKKECSNRRRGRRRQATGVGGARRAGTGETKGRGRSQGRRSGGLMQTVDVQDIGVSKLAKTFQHRWSLSVKRTGQGGGAVGRKLVVKTREFIRSGRGYQRRRGHGAEWDIERCANILLKTEAGTSVQHSRRKATPHQESPYIQRVQSVTRPQVTVRHPEEQPEQIDRLLEEVMMGLDIIPNNSKKSQVTISAAVTTTTNSCVQGRQQSQQRGPQFQGSPHVVAVPSGGREPSDVPALQQQNEGELTDILDQFLQSFEQLESAAAQNSSQSHTSVNEYRKSNIQVTVHTPLQQHSPSLRETAAQPGHRPAHSETGETDSPVVPLRVCAQKKPPKHGSEKSSSPAVRQVTRRKSRDYLFSLEKPRVKTKKATTSTKALTKEEVVQRVNRQLKQIPVVKLERRSVLPDNIRIQELSQRPVQRSSRSPSAKACSFTPLWSTKIYPIRSRFREAQIMDSIAFLEEPLSKKASKGRPRKNGLLPSFSAQNILMQAPRSSLSTLEERMENNQDMEGSDHREAHRRGRKRGLESDKDTDSDAVEIKRICLDPDAALECIQYSSEDGEEVIDVETVSLNSTENTVLINNTETRNEKVLDLTTEERSADTESDEIIDVEDCFESTELKKDDVVHAEVICSLSTSTVITGSPIEDIEDDIDVIGASCPIPAPVFIDWTDTSESDEEDVDIDVQEEETAYMSSVTLSKGELVRC